MIDGKVPRFHIPELLPLLLLGITDDCPDLAISSLEKLEGVGKIYQKFIDALDTRNLQVWKAAVVTNCCRSRMLLRSFWNLLKTR